MILFLSIFITVYTALNFYVFIRGWQVISSYSYLKPIYIVLFVIAAYSYIIAKAFYNYLNPLLHDVLIWIGSFWFAFLVYFILSLLFLDILRFVGFKFHLFPESLKQNYNQVKLITASAVIILVSIVVLFGYLNTRKIGINYKEIEVPKSANGLKELNIVMVADIHLSPINDEKFLSAIVDKINSLNPDIILMPGDIVDDRAAVLKRNGIGGSLKRLKSKYGTYVSNGNHEFINNVEEADSFLSANGLYVLQDSSLIIDNSFYVVGREDRSKNNFTMSKRKELSEIVNELDKSLPIILLDHTPSGLNVVKKNGMDLQLSGHTHHGQFFPANLITNLVYEVSWGYLKKGSTHYFVTCGVGTWGPPVRNVSSSEIVNIKLKFN